MINEPREEVLEIDLHDIFAKIVKHRRLIINLVLISAALALLYSFISHPVFKSTARIMVEGRPPKIVKVEDVVLPDYTDRTNYYNSQIEVLKSHSIANLVYDELGSYEPWGNLRGRQKKQITFTKEERVEELLKKVRISPVRMTQIIEISAEDVDSNLAAKIVNTWVNAYIVFSSMDQFIQRKSELEADLDQNLKYIKEKHPVIQGLRSEIAAIDAKINGEKQKILSSQSAAFSFTKDDQKITNVKILDSGTASKKPVRPRLLLNLALALFIGAFGGVGAAFLLESIDQSLKLQTDIESSLHLPCLATVPLYSPEKGKEIPSALISSQDINSMFSERFRSLRTGIIYSNPDLSKKVLLITSAGPSEGKTTTAVNLATAFAQSDEKTILIDADLRKPTLHTVFSVPCLQGITGLLAQEKIDIKPYVKKTGIPNLDFIPCGIIPPNPAEILGSKKIEALITELSLVYDRIIFDTPPVLAATDAVILSTKVAATIFVFKAGFTHKQAALRAVKLIQSVHSHILGVVLNMLKAEDYGYYSYYHYYNRYPRKDKKNKKA